MEDLDWKILITPLLSFVGVIIAAFLAFFSSSFLKKKETKLKISEKILDKKFEAHENVLELAKILRSTFSNNIFNAEMDLIVYPSILSSKENYLEWKKDLFIKSNTNSHWLSTGVHKELSFMQEYFLSLDKTLENIPDENLMKVSLILKNDFDDLSKNLEKQIVIYFETGWKDLKTISRNENAKYAINVSERRNNNYSHAKRHLEISKYFYRVNEQLPKTDIKPVTLLYEVANNGLKINMVKIVQVPYSDNSGVEYELFYQENEFNNKYEKFGYCELTGGTIRFDKTTEYIRHVGISNEAMMLLSRWIKENKDTF